MRVRRVVVDLLLFCAVATALGSTWAIAQEPEPAPAAADTPPAPEPVPPYFTGTNPEDPDKPGETKTLWPDPTGANAGAWITPAPDPGDGNPEKRTIPDLYDRIAHNMFSINMVWTL